MLRKFVSGFLCAALLSSSAFSAPAPVQSELNDIEKEIYGQAQSGAIMDRITRVEDDTIGTHSIGSIQSRVADLRDVIYSNDEGPSLLAKINAIEWSVNHEIQAASLKERLDSLEIALKGETAEGSLQTRVDTLAELAFGSSDIPMENVLVPANTLIKIALAQRVNAKELTVGDEVRYRVAEDLLIDGKLVFPKGVYGVGKVTKVKQARNFGRNAEVEIDFSKLQSADGRFVDTFVGEESKKEMKNLAMAAGAGLAGMALLGPIGAMAAVFVNGKNVDLPEGTEVIIQTKSDANVWGIDTGNSTVSLDNNEE